MVHEFNRRQPKPPSDSPRDPTALMADDGAPPPTEIEREQAKDRLRSIALPDERF